MSLFKTREYWSTKVGSEEEYDLGCLCIANIDNHQNGAEKIIVGSFSGFLRIFLPGNAAEGASFCPFKPSDLLYEQQLPQPILQLAAARLLPGSESMQLAVLLMRKVAVYSVKASAAVVEHGRFCELKLLYEHQLERSAYNLACGSFGSIKGRDFLCVQSLDGTFSFFEQESFAFQRYLPGALLPGPICYMAATDSFLTVSSSRMLECYRYQVLAAATSSSSKEESKNLKSGKKILPEWSRSIGESALDIQIANTNADGKAKIFVLGERNLLVFDEAGKMIYMKKFDFNPSSFLVYQSKSEDTLTMVASHCNTIQFFNANTLKWVAHTASVPVQLSLINLRFLPGCMVGLSEAGRLQCFYLGTDPAVFSPPASVSRVIDYEQEDREMSQLQSQIKQSSGKIARPKPSEHRDSELEIRFEVPHLFDNPSKADLSTTQTECSIPSISVRVSIKSRTFVKKVTVALETPPPLFCSFSEEFFEELGPAAPHRLTLIFYMKRLLVPSDLNVHLVASYTTSSGSGRVCHSTAKLPLGLVAKPAAPMKYAAHKITVNSNKSMVNLNPIFPDLLGDNETGPGTALAFQYFGGPVVTLLASKNTKRYRLQSDDFGAIWLILNELNLRVCAHYRSLSQKDFTMLFDDDLPLQEYFDVMDRHFEFRKLLKDKKIQLESRAVQFRAIQRRLLTRYKEPSPPPLMELDTLLEGTYHQISQLSSQLEQVEDRREAAAVNLSAATRLFTCILRFWRQMNDDEFLILQSAMPETIFQFTDYGWEEAVDVSVTHLLRTSLSKAYKDKTINPAPLEILRDTDKLKKHISLFCERLARGGSLIRDSKGGFSSERVDSNDPVLSAFKQEDLPDRSANAASDAGTPFGTSFVSRRVVVSSRRPLDEESTHAASRISRNTSFEDALPTITVTSKEEQSFTDAVPSKIASVNQTSAEDSPPATTDNVHQASFEEELQAKAMDPKSNFSSPNDDHNGVYPENCDDIAPSTGGDGRRGSGDELSPWSDNDDDPLGIEEKKNPLGNSLKGL